MKIQHERRWLIVVVLFAHAALCATPVLAEEGTGLLRAEAPASGGTQTTGAYYPYPQPLPKSGEEVAQFHDLDGQIEQLMLQWAIPGCTFAVAHNGDMAYSRAIGWADVADKTPVTTASIFRVASISKVLTATAILMLVDQGKLHLDDRVVPILQEKLRLDAQAIPPTCMDITIRHLLQHTTGWDEMRHHDPELQNIRNAARRSLPPTARVTAADLVHFGLNRKPEYFVGTRFCYSNLGYVILGQIIEKIANEPYAEFIRSKMLLPAGISTIELGSNNAEKALPGEVHYYDFPGAQYVRDFEGNTSVPEPYGGFDLELLGAAMGWTGRAEDLINFTSALLAKRTKNLVLSAASLNNMFDESTAVTIDSESRYGLGWRMRNNASGRICWHSGSAPGTLALLEFNSHNWSWAILLNSRPKDFEKCLSRLKLIFEDAFNKTE